jgi:alpha-beta hydrolase superfamily lysophospholipase
MAAFIRSRALLCLRPAAILFGLLLAAACTPRVIGPGPAVQEPALSTDRLQMADGAVLPLRSWAPAGEPRAVILALHGFNDYSKAFEAPGAYFARQGALTYAYDQRSFGDAPNTGIWPGTEALTQDLRTAVRLVRQRHPDLPLILLGESMGGAVIMAALAEQPLPEASGIVLVAPAVWSRDVMPAWQRTALNIAAHSIPAMQFTGGDFGKVPSDNIAMLRKLSRDPKVIKWTRVDAIYGLANLMDAAYDAAPALHGNILIQFGDKEDILPETAMRQFEMRLPKTQCGVRLATYKSGFHMLLRDLKAAIVMRDIAAWVADDRAQLPSGSEKALPFAVAERAQPGKEGDGAAVPHALNCASPNRHARP